MFGCLGLLIDSSTGRTMSRQEFLNAVNAAMDKYYNIVPLAGETVQETKNAIIRNLLVQIGDNWNAGMSPEEIIANPNLEESIYDYSPHSSRKISGTAYGPPLPPGFKPPMGPPLPPGFKLPTTQQDADKLLSTPGPGKVPVSFSPDNLKSIIDAYFGFMTEANKAKVYAKLLKQGKGYMPQQHAQAMGLSTEAKVGIGIGVVAMIGLVGFLIYKAAKGK